MHVYSRKQLLTGCLCHFGLSTRSILFSCRESIQTSLTFSKMVKVLMGEGD